MYSEILTDEVNYDLFPKTLYKYRSWDNKFHKSILTNNEVFLSSAELFNDPFDAKVPFRYDEKEMTDDNIFIKLYQVGKESWPELSEKELIDKCYEQQKTGIFKDDRCWKNKSQEIIDSFNKTYGILSLTPKSNNLLMWSHYADSHKGFCIGFDTKLLAKSINGLFGNVNYSDKVPVQSMFAKPMQNCIAYLMTKSKEWEYEEEYRITKIFASNTPVRFPKEAIKEVILGLSISEENRNEITNIVKEHYTTAKLFQSIRSDKMFKIELEEI